MEPITAQLAALHDEYVAAVNDAVAQDRDDLVRRLADEYTDVAARIIASAAV